MVEPQIRVIFEEKLCCGWVVVFSLKNIGLELGLWCLIVTKVVLVLLLGCVIKSNCGCGRSSLVDCVVVVQFSFCSSLLKSSSKSMKIKQIILQLTIRLKYLSAPFTKHKRLLN